MKLNFSKRLTIPIIILIIASLSISGIVLYNQSKNNLEDLLVEQSNSELLTIKHIVENQQELASSIKNEIGESYESIIKSIDTIIQNDPNMLTEENLSNLNSRLGLNAINVTDENGVVVYSSEEESIGFDLNSSDKSKPFIELLTSDTEFIVEEPHRRDGDDKLYQYAGIKRLDDVGIIQIGIDPEKTANIGSLLDTSNYIKNIELGNDGYIYVVNEEGKFLLHPEEELEGTMVENQSIKDILQMQNGNLTYQHQGRDEIAVFETTNGITMVIAKSIDTLKSIQASFLRTIGIILIIVSILSIFVIKLIVSKFANKPLKEVINAMERVENGELDVQITNNSNDEFGYLSRSFNNMVENTKDLISSIVGLSESLDDSLINIAENARGVGIASEEVSNTVYEMAEGSTNQAKDTGEALDLTNTLSERIENMTEGLKEAMESSLYMQEQNNKGEMTIYELKEKLKDNENASLKVSQSVETLSEKSLLIGNILGAIEGISEQINLLSLNAAIEAARAGEHGYGFAVVADEIRTLSEETNNSTSEIQNIIREIQQVIEDTSDNTELSRQAVENANNTLTETEKVTLYLSESVEASIEKVESLNDEVVNINDIKDKTVYSIENISAQTQEYAASTEEISASAEEQTASMEEVISTIDSLNEMSSRLEELVHQFKM